MIEPLKAVYSYYYPEVRDIISRVTADYPHEVFLRSVDPGLDDFHVPVIEAYLQHMQDQLPDLGQFPYQYTTAGSEAIFHILAEISAFRREVPLYVLEGEYEGFSGYGQNIGLSFTSVPEDQDMAALPAGIFFVSNPSARDGNTLADGLLEKIGIAGHEIVCDLTYVGMTDPQQILVDHPYISKVVVSLSKPFGLYYYRIGFCFSRTEMKTLMVNKWFKNILSLIIAKQVLSELGSSELSKTYRAWQQRAVDTLSERWGIPVQASDVMLLAHIQQTDVPEDKREALEKYRRGDRYRFCLTPFYLMYEQENV